MKYGLLYLVIMFSPFCGNAQLRLSDLRESSIDTLDYSKIRCLYKQLVMKDTLRPEKLTEDIMALQIGTKMNKYSCFRSILSDSLKKVDRKSNPDINFIESVNNGRYNPGNDFIELFKNYPSGKNTTTNNVFIDFYTFEEDIEVPVWKISQSRKTILGYSCIQATTSFLGRNYEAWFTTEIPISEGPWKFIGLPGLILEISDSRKEYSFECIQIQNVTWKDPIYLCKEHLIRTNKRAYYKTLKRFCENPGGMITNMDKIQGSEQLRTAKKQPYNPIERIE